MTISEFLNVYRRAFKRDGMVALSVWKKPIFGFLSPPYSNNKLWRQQTFRVSSQWEAAESELLAKAERVPQDWALLQANFGRASEVRQSSKEECGGHAKFFSERVKFQKDEFQQ
jgi:hypothetical protein